MTRRNGTGTCLAVGGGVVRGGGGGLRASRTDQRKEKGERMGESGVGRGVIQTPGAGRSFYISLLNQIREGQQTWRATRAKVANVYRFSLSDAKDVAPNQKMLSQESPLVIMVKS